MLVVFGFNLGASGQIVDYLQIPPSADSLKLGAAISMPTPNTIAVGMPGYNSNGAVLVFDKQNGGGWIFRGMNFIVPNLPDQYSYFGRAVHMPDSNTLVVGAPEYNVNIGTSSSAQRSGKVFVFRWNGTNWVQKGDGLFYDNNGTGDYPQFGYRVHMSDSNHLAASFMSSDGNLLNRGGVITYEWNGTSWVQRGSVLQGSGTGAYFGRELAMPTSDYLAVAAPLQKNSTHEGAGRVEFYVWNGNDWDSSHAIAGSVAGEELGSAIDMPNDSTIAITRLDPAAVGVYIKSSTGSWSSRPPAISRVGTAGTFGQALSMLDSDHIAIANVGESEPSGNGINSVRVYEYNATAYQWNLIAGPFWGEQGEDFGCSVSLADLSGVAVGAQLYNHPYPTPYNPSVGRVHMITFVPLPEGGDSTATGCYTCDSLQVGDVYRFNGDTLTVVNRAMLDSMVTNGGDFSKVCVTNVTDMSSLFENETTFNQDISRWDVSSLTTMNKMFREAKVFNQPIGGWDVSNVTDMGSLFSGANAFNQDIGDWDVSSVTDMRRMFAETVDFNQDIGDWDVSSLTEMDGMFMDAAAFNQPIGDWDVSNVTDFAEIFQNTGAFNQDIGNWDVSNSTGFYAMFYNNTVFNQDLSGWCVYQVSSEPMFFAPSLVSSFKPLWGTCNSKGATLNPDSCIQCDNYAPGEIFYLDGVLYTVADESMIDSLLTIGQNFSTVCTSKMTDLNGMFAENDTFNDDIGMWDVSNVTDMNGLFQNASAFNQDIGNWDVSSVTNMNSMFYGAASFNQDIGDWDVSGVTNMRSMFFGCHDFNQDISDWDVSSVINFAWMFANAREFNQDIGSWDVSNANSLNAMFASTRKFNQDIGSWDVSNATRMHSFLYLNPVFSQDLSGWCVGNNFSQAPRRFSKKTIFGNASNLTPAQMPAWGVPCTP